MCVRSWDISTLSSLLVNIDQIFILSGTRQTLGGQAMNPQDETEETAINIHERAADEAVARSLNVLGNCRKPYCCKDSLIVFKIDRFRLFL